MRPYGVEEVLALEQARQVVPAHPLAGVHPGRAGLPVLDVLDVVDVAVDQALRQVPRRAAQGHLVHPAPAALQVPGPILEFQQPRRIRRVQARRQTVGGHHPGVFLPVLRMNQVVRGIGIEVPEGTLGGRNLILVVDVVDELEAIVVQVDAQHLVVIGIVQKIHDLRRRALVPRQRKQLPNHAATLLPPAHPDGRICLDTAPILIFPL